MEFTYRKFAAGEISTVSVEIVKLIIIYPNTAKLGITFDSKLGWRDMSRKEEKNCIPYELIY